MHEQLNYEAKTDDGLESPFAWGADEIGAVIGRDVRQTFHLLNTGQLKSAKKIGGRWVANREALIRELGGK
jgi:hypothetical protein